MVSPLSPVIPPLPFISLASAEAAVISLVAATTTDTQRLSLQGLVQTRAEKHTRSDDGLILPDEGGVVKANGASGVQLQRWDHAGHGRLTPLLR